MLPADDTALRDIEQALEVTERSSEDLALGLARFTLGVALVHRDSRAERERGLAVLGQVRDMSLNGRFYVLLPVVDVFTARERARRGDRDTAIPQLRELVDDLFHQGNSCTALWRPAFWWRRCCSAAPPVTSPKPPPRSTDRRPPRSTRGWFTVRSWLLRMRALLARARGDEAGDR